MIWTSEQTFHDTFELDELYWFINQKANTETRENTYLMTMVSRMPRQIVGYEVAKDKTAQRLQRVVDSMTDAQAYCTDGYVGYLDTVFPGIHIRNVHNKNDTFTVESVNADLRHYIPVLRRRSRCFCRNLSTLQAVVAVFVDAYNKFGEAKMLFRRNRNSTSRELPFSLLDFI